MKINHFSKENTLLYKGIGILFIVLHNFFHWMPPWTDENEWDFDPNRIVALSKGLFHYPLELFNLFFSYFGHYGVQLFIFVSGVGLALSMQNKSRNWQMFMIERLKKLYPLLITGFVFLFFYEIILSGKLLGWYQCREFLYKLLFIHTFNVLQGSALSLSGPWWFFGLIFQLYIVFPFLFKMIKKYHVKAFITICFISYVWIYISQYVYQPKANIILFQHAPGHLPEFALGILFAVNPNKKIHSVWGVLALAIFVLGNFYKLFFPFTFLSITVLLYWAISNISPLILGKTQKLKAVLFYYGSLSMMLFVIHGPLRNPFIAISETTFYGRLFGAALFLIAATAFSITGNILYKWLIKIFTQQKD